MINILYVHGFGSQFDPSSLKMITLGRLGRVYGVNVDWTRPAEQSIFDISESAVNADLIVGTSMGGWGAAIVGALRGIPFVAINPAVRPQDVLRKRLGSGVDHQGIPYHLSEEVLSSYAPITGEGYGLILLDKGDEVIPYQPTLDALEDHYDINMFEGGSHRFEHMEEALPIIQNFYNRASVSYGNDV